MNPDKLNQFHNKITSFNSPEELFGELKGTTVDEILQSLNEVYKELIKTYHPDKFVTGDNGIRYVAGQISGIINEFNTQAKNKIEKNLYGKEVSLSNEDISFEIKTKSKTIRVYEHFMESDYSNLYKGEFKKSRSNKETVCIKIIKDKSDNELIKNEISILKSIHHKSLPVFFDEFMISTGEIGFAQRFIDGFDFISILEKYPSGLPQEHTCWILERLLSVLGYMHHNNILHGNIEPGNIIVRAYDHNVFLIDFLFSIQNANNTIETYKCFTENYSAPETKLKKKPIPSSDIYSLGKSILYLLGGDVENNKFPKSVDKRLIKFLSGFLETSPIKRPKDAWELWHELSSLREEIFGSRHQFLELEI